VNAIAAKADIADPRVKKSAPSQLLTPWSKRVRWVGGLMQTAFAAFWLVRGGAAIGGDPALASFGVFGLLALGALLYATRFAAGAAPRPSASAGERIERQVTIVAAAGHSDWVLPSIAITVGPLLLWLDRKLSVPRYRVVGWTLTIGPVALVATMSGSALVASTGICAGLLLLGTALAGFHDLAAVRSSAQRCELDDGVLGTARVQR